jgi:uncharacterized protein YggE
LAAVEDAVTRARDYATALGADIVGLMEIADLGMSQQTSQPVAGFAVRAMGARESAGGPEFNLDPGHQEVVGHVEARFQLTEPDLSRFPSSQD